MSQSPPIHHKSIKILIVDDSASIRELARYLLKAAGFENIDDTINGKLALEMLKNNSYDILISDWEMPELNGLELFKHIKDDNSYGNPKFILLSSVAQRNRIVEAINAGIRHYVVKPFTSQTLCREILCRA